MGLIPLLWLWANHFWKNEFGASSAVPGAPLRSTASMSRSLVLAPDSFREWSQYNPSSCVCRSKQEGHWRSYPSVPPKSACWADRSDPLPCSLKGAPKKRTFESSNGCEANPEAKKEIKKPASPILLRSPDSHPRTALGSSLTTKCRRGRDFSFFFPGGDSVVLVGILFSMVSVGLLIALRHTVATDAYRWRDRSAGTLEYCFPSRERTRLILQLMLG